MSARFTRTMEALARDAGVSARTAGCLERICAEFATEDDFFRATRGDLMRVFAKLEPDAKRGLGEKTFDAFSKARALWTSDEVAKAASLPDPLSRPATQELLLWMASFLEQNRVEKMPFGRLLDIWDQVREAKG